MSKLFNFELTFTGKFKCTAASEEDAHDKLMDELGNISDVNVTDVDYDDFDPGEDDLI